MDNGRNGIRTIALVLGTALAVTAAPALARTVVDYAKNAGHLRGLPAKSFQRTCSPGTVAGFAQVPSDVASSWTQVDGYGASQFSIGPSRQGAGPPCRSETALAKHVSTGVYEVALNSSLAGDCQLSSMPRPGDTLPAVVSVVSDTALAATYTTSCDPNDKGYVEQVRITTPAGAPADAAFTIETLEPVIVAQP